MSTFSILYSSTLFKQYRMSQVIKLNIFSSSGTLVPILSTVHVHRTGLIIKEYSRNPTVKFHGGIIWDDFDEKRNTTRMRRTRRRCGRNDEEVATELLVDAILYMHLGLLV